MRVCCLRVLLAVRVPRLLYGGRRSLSAYTRFQGQCRSVLPCCMLVYSPALWGVLSWLALPHVLLIWAPCAFSSERSGVSLA